MKHESRGTLTPDAVHARPAQDGATEPCRRNPILIIALLAGTVPLVAQEPSARAPMDEPLVTDRPDFTESTEAVPAGHFQFEAGYTFRYDRERDVRIRNHTAPELLFRLGVVEDLELRIGWEGYSWSERSLRGARMSGTGAISDDWSQGAHDLSLGVKYKLFEQDGWRPHFGVIAGLSAPSGSPSVSSGDVEPEMIWLWAYDVTDDLAIAGNVGLSGPTDAGERFLQTAASLSVAYALTERVGTYVEYFGLYPNSDDSDCAHSLNTGLTFLVTKNLQLDWRVGLGINEEADDFFTGIGFAWRR